MHFQVIVIFNMADHELDALEERLDFIENIVFGNSEKDAFYPKVRLGYIDIYWFILECCNCKLGLFIYYEFTLHKIGTVTLTDRMDGLVQWLQ